jgi:ribonuclease G
MTKHCPTCQGEGVVKSEETIAIQTARRLRELVAATGDSAPEAYLVRLNPKVTAWFTADGARELHVLESETGRRFFFEGSEGLPLEHFAITMEDRAEEIEEHAVPFRAGEEAHVHIVEPHMYDPDAAVAKVDGYLITVRNGLAFVGEKKLVSIQEADRTAAVATLVGEDAEVASNEAEERAKARERSDQRARRSAAAKKGAASRKARQSQSKPRKSPTKEEEAAAVETLSDEEHPTARGGTAPAAVEDAGDEALSSRSRRRGRRGGRRRSRAKAD